MKRALALVVLLPLYVIAMLGVGLSAVMESLLATRNGRGAKRGERVNSTGKP